MCMRVTIDKIFVSYILLLMYEEGLVAHAILSILADHSVLHQNFLLQVVNTVFQHIL